MGRSEGLNRVDKNSDPQHSIVAFPHREHERAIEQVSGIAKDPLTLPEVPDLPAPIENEERIEDEQQPNPPPVGPNQPIVLEQVIDAIYQSYPLLRIAIAGRDIAAG